MTTLSLSFLNYKMGILIIQLLEWLKGIEQVNTHKSLGTASIHRVLDGLIVTIVTTVVQKEACLTSSFFLQTVLR